MTRDDVALTILSGRTDIIHANEDIQVEFISKALSFADLFLDMADDENIKESNNEKN